MIDLEAIVIVECEENEELYLTGSIWELIRIKGELKWKYKFQLLTNKKGGYRFPLSDKEKIINKAADHGLLYLGNMMYTQHVSVIYLDFSGYF